MGAPGCDRRPRDARRRLRRWRAGAARRAGAGRDVGEPARSRATRAGGRDRRAGPGHDGRAGGERARRNRPARAVAGRAEGSLGNHNPVCRRGDVAVRLRGRRDRHAAVERRGRRVRRPAADRPWPPCIPSRSRRVRGRVAGAGRQADRGHRRTRRATWRDLRPQQRAAADRAAARIQGDRDARPRPAHSRSAGYPVRVAACDPDSARSIRRQLLAVRPVHATAPGAPLYTARERARRGSRAAGIRDLDPRRRTATRLHRPQAAAAAAGGAGTARSAGGRR